MKIYVKKTTAKVKVPRLVKHLIWNICVLVLFIRKTEIDNWLEYQSVIKWMSAVITGSFIEQIVI